jgi:hypothetical protein
MSQQEIVDAYVNGDMSRRVFIRRLAASGVALGAAVSYAHLLTPEVKAQGVVAYGYNPPTLSGLQMVPEDLDTVIKKQRIKIRGTSDQPATFGVNIHLYRPARKTEWPDAIIGATAITFDAAGTQTFKVPIAPNYPALENFALIALKKQKRKAKIGVHQFEGDVDPVSANAIVYRR